MSSPRHYTICIGSRKPIRSLPADFLSLTIDSSLLLGGHWWGKSRSFAKGVSGEQVAPLDLEHSQLVAYAAQLAPAMLRIGGTEADWVRYKMGKKALRKLRGAKPASHRIGNSNDRPAYELVLKKGVWKRLNRFIKESGFDLLFTLSAGPADRDSNGAWRSDNAMRLVAYSVQKGFRVAAWEFGNEVNGFPFLYGPKKRVSASQYSRDFEYFSESVKHIDPQAKIIGPASAIWPIIGEPNPIIKKLCVSPAARHLDAVSWHYYPQQSHHGPIAVRRAGTYRMLSPGNLNDIVRWNRNIQRYLKKSREHPTSTENWLTETAHALYGGEPGLSDSFVSTLWWLDELGVLARNGVDKVFRQSLIGARYGLLDQESMKPKPDYYASFLWKKLMGNLVLETGTTIGTNKKLRYYRHTTGAYFAGSAAEALLLINLNRKTSAHVEITTPDAPFSIGHTILLQADGGFTSKSMLVNGVPAEDDLVFSWGTKKVMKKYKISGKKNERITKELSLPPLSALFYLFARPEN
ncbi:glycosyl hydrolase family 79 N-terminal domain-containing protein [Sediminispirochaeta smaragdinae]|nr:glycoside hydrolase [Sediminispirochaeta smaragdinae]